VYVLLGRGGEEEKKEKGKKAHETKESQEKKFVFGT
jgi:hypothetical protein